ncbi:MAG: MarR family transcriptional regulator [Rhodobacteraceae bacterium]|nr:MarR family transcriptional regulator [Paracoccaceae bacterium]
MVDKVNINPAGPDIEVARLIDRMTRRIHAALNARAAEFDRHRVGPAGGILLLTLADHEPARVQDLVRLMARDKGQMTRGVQALERKGLIARRDCADDARVSLLVLTEEGHRAVGELQHAVAEALDGILAPLPAADRRQLKAILAKL